MCAACGPEPRDVTDAGTPDAFMLPPGVWEPDPGVGRAAPSLISEGADVWFAFNRFTQTSPTSSEVWLTKTTSSGDPRVAPLLVTDPGTSGGGPALTLTTNRVAVSFIHYNGALPYVRVYDRSGAPFRSTAHAVATPSGIGQLRNLQLIAASTGMLRLVATLQYNMTAEVVALDLDEDGDATGTSALLGTADEGTPYVVSAAAADDGSSLIAWDHQYDACTSQKPSVTRAGRIDPGGSLDPTRTVPDAAGLSEIEPAIASKGSTSYIAWVVNLPNRSSISIARFDDFSSAVAETGDVQRFNRRPFLALAAPGRGAIAWSTSNPELLHVAAFRDQGTSIAVEPARIFSMVLADTQFGNLAGLVHVGDDRYVMGWTEEPFVYQHVRLFATEVDFGQEAAPAPPIHPAAPATPRRQRPCSH